MVVAKKMKEEQKNKSEANAMVGFLKKEYPTINAEAKQDDKGEWGVSFHDTFIRVSHKFRQEVERWLIMNGWVKTFTHTVLNVIEFLENEKELEKLDEVPVCSFRFLREEHDSRIYHQIIFDEAKRNAGFKWTEKEGSNIETRFIETVSNIWGFNCKVGFDPFQLSYVTIYKRDAKKFAEFLRKNFIGG